MNAVILTTFLGHQLLQTCLSIRTIISHSSPATCFSRAGTEAREHQHVSLCVTSLFCSADRSKLAWCSCYWLNWHGGGKATCPDHEAIPGIPKPAGWDRPSEWQLGPCYVSFITQRLTLNPAQQHFQRKTESCKASWVLASESVGYYLAWFCWPQQVTE